ncbi:MULTISPECIES: K(+)-transporting ATPase subunit C [Micrococcales]|mgnify:FL=1|jgi:K+-transporting ATPase ATPase C chain|uniref:Potassium-transporting ATPase KdpC subunit n=1 Tax=Microbacterium binotii TaxID=462710 RepID=A0ABP6BPG3_9MICO|nr:MULTISPECIES: K(+)-transporting ATPase subunit C [Microbacterium]MBD3759042.1 K(+)-transporting ATPase subunit C [Microbacterium sp.]MCG7414409.1 K(+)-transporting ATPase subunit C [Microbacterium aurum]ONI66703.1 potassium-transporting ATPase subunit C [Microbacterium sp. CSI-V]PZU44110.1 MAG: K(+)-transporting ATPase subunit C [Microbacterium sp.]RCL91663.1 MAG: K(+)-transporting ATPase subunit C [Microbacterium sp.]
MNTATRSTGRSLWVATRALLLFTVVLGIGYTLLITAVGQLAFPAQANGSLVRNAEGEVVGSSLIGQNFTAADGEPLPEYFQPRPSAAGDGYDGGASSGSNWGPENEDLIAAIEERKAQIAEFNGVSPDEIPADAVTASSSGLDPHISPQYAQLQVQRVSDARGLTVDQVQGILDEHAQGRDLGYLGEPTVNVVELNLALDQLED